MPKRGLKRAMKSELHSSDDELADAGAASSSAGAPAAGAGAAASSSAGSDATVGNPYLVLAPAQPPQPPPPKYDVWEEVSLLRRAREAKEKEAEPNPRVIPQKARPTTKTTKLKSNKIGSQGPTPPKEPPTERQRQLQESEGMQQGPKLPKRQARSWP